MTTKSKKRISIYLTTSLLLVSSFLPCYAENSNDISSISNDEVCNNALSLYSYIDKDSGKIFSEMCLFSDEVIPKIFCSYDNENFVLTEAAEENKFSFSFDQNFDEVYVKAVQTFNDGTVSQSNIQIVNISESLYSVNACTDDCDDLGYIPDLNLAEPITVMPRNFPYLAYQYPEGSYFSETGVACTCHSYCNWYNPGDCTVFDNAIQCEGFARKVYYEINDKHLGSTQTYNGNLTVDKAKALFKSPIDSNIVGAYLRVRTSNGYEHSIVIVHTNDKRLSVYHANYGGPCLVRYQGYTWEDFVKAFPYLYYYSK